MMKIESTNCTNFDQSFMRRNVQVGIPANVDNFLVLDGMVGLFALVHSGPELHLNNGVLLAKVGTQLSL